MGKNSEQDLIHQKKKMANYILEMCTCHDIHNTLISIESPKIRFLFWQVFFFFSLILNP